MSRRPDPHARNLFSVPEPVSVGFGEDVLGRGTLAAKIVRVIARAMQDARDDTGMTRDLVAAGMSGRLGRKVTKAMLDQWTSESREDSRIPLDAFIALIAETKAYEALGFIPQQFGYAVVEEKYLELIELSQIEEHERLLEARKATLQAKARARR